MRLLSLSLISLWLCALPAMAEMRVEKIGPDLTYPWGLDFLDDGSVMVTTRPGQLYHINLQSGSSKEIGNLPEVAHFGQGGLLDVAIAGDDIFLCYAKPFANGAATAIDKATLKGDRLTGRMTIFTSNRRVNSAHHFGCRLVLDGRYIYASFGDRGMRHSAQKPAFHDGSIIRIHQDGTVPDPQFDGWAEGIFSIGHRNPQGMARHPETGAIWAHEHGPKGGDEINIITKGGNYGWPLVSHGKEYGTDTPVSKLTSHPDMIDPVWVWVPSIAPSGMAFYPKEGAMFPQLQNSLLVGSLKFRRLYQVMMGTDGLPVSEVIILDKSLGRIRDVAVAPDGSILILNDANDAGKPTGGLYRLSQ